MDNMDNMMDNAVEDISDPASNNLVDIVSDHVELFKKPNGTKINPARTCGDLHMDYPELKSG